VKQGRIHTVAQILRRVDQRAIQIEDQQFQSLNGKGAKFVNHVFSVTGSAQFFQDANDSARTGAAIPLKERYPADINFP
jgi:hypothetical protein